MKRAIPLLAAILILSAGPLYALYQVKDGGDWPKDWPQELEPLRKQARTFEGPMFPQVNYAIPFTTREEFEAAWPHILKVKTEGAPIVLRRGPSFWLDGKGDAGVCIHTLQAHGAPKDKVDAALEEAKKRGAKSWINTTYIELIVDGKIVDLNRIPLPAETLIVDERFGEGKTK
ncbi:hypothetical protein Mal52_55320 [Symmachiella dynata]|uniref:Uncharacterized protein n=1 Tax=Symmachiella dynata TaxID=2527995 RepID=A0A517ZX01_9PLAN|nr:hypothetical protein [Symmachiella dynata]QDU47004.1 hypothetical protein Mal52_55320 [Symmachiella dynata]